MSGVITKVYVGHRDAMLAEIGEHLDIYKGKYLVYPVNDTDQFDAEGVSSKRAVRDLLKDYRFHYPTIEVVWI
jgi:hypothetical protein